MDTSILVIIVQLIFLEGILSIDNAAALGAMVAPLSDHDPIPWPHWLGRLHRLDRWLGPQRSAALKVGLIGAYIGRGLMLLIATIVIQNPWLRLLGGSYLLYLALSYLAKLGRTMDEDEDEKRLRIKRPSFWMIVLMVEVADLAFSLDNVVAAVALSRELWVVMLGVGIGILLMRFAASMFSRLMEWEPSLEVAAYLLIVAIGVEVVLDDLFHIHFQDFRVYGLPINSEVQQFGVSALIILLTLAFARIPWLRPLNKMWRPLLKLSVALHTAIDILLTPVRVIFQLLGRLLGRLLPKPPITHDPQKEAYGKSERTNR